MVNFLVWLVVGAVVGWVASMVMGTNGRQGLLLDIIVGIAGAFVAGWFIAQLFGLGTINQSDFSLPSLLVSLAGAILLLAVVRMFRWGTVSG